MERSQPTSSLSASAPSWPPSAVNSLDALDRLVLSNRGALYEGDIFSILKRSLFVIRSFEFALADGAIDCSGGCSPDTSFADRFWDVDQELLLNPTSKKLVLFDVKSKVSQSAGDQIYSTTVGQRHHVAFYIGICAADLSFVELFPNYHQKHSAAVTADALDTDSRHVGVNSSRVSKLPPSTYILDPCNAPYRMPIRYLVEAIERVRRCVQSGEIYVNPWTKVSFPEWKPLTTGLTEMLKPSESSEHFTAYNATLEIYRFFKGQSMKLDFVGLQPRLADFKLLAARLPNLAGHHSHNHSQIFVQHKLDARDRALDSKLTKVAIARGQGDDCRYYFSDIDRFDFLFYQFSFSNRPYPQPIVEFFFIPEREIPNVFYETNAIEESFEYPHFAKYRTRMDKNGKWIRHILQIIQDNPRPRQTVPRPSRLTALSKIPDAVPSEPELRIIRSPAAPGPTDQKTQSGRALYKDSMTRGHRQFYFNIMMECAKRYVPSASLHIRAALADLSL